MSREGAGAVLLCGGSGQRMGERNKLLLPILGKTSVERALGTLLACDEIDRIVLVLREDAQLWDYATELTRKMAGGKPVFLTKGGESRGASVWNGLLALAADGLEPRWAAIHDAARPLFSPDTLGDCLESVEKYGSGIAGTPVADTLRRADEEQFWLEEVDREGVWMAETPQCFRFGEIYQAYALSREQGREYTDDAAVYAAWGGRPRMVASREENRKLTWPGDVQKMEAILWGRKGDDMGLRIGLGEDRHRLCPERPLILGGVEIPHDMGLEGHSDADALCHALSDALLGALGLGDIGRHFPDTDPRFKGADSVKLLREVYAMVRTRGMRLLNADGVITAEAPKLAPHIPAMERNLERALSLPPGTVSVKAKTGEGLGPEGRGEAISVSVVVLLGA